MGDHGGAGLIGALYILGPTTSMSVYTVLATEYTKETDPSLLTVLQMLVSAVFGFALWMATDAGSLFTIEWSETTLSFIFLIAFFSKCYAYLMLMYADKYADAVSVTIVASTEPVVTLLAAVLLPDALGGVEQFTTRAVAGAGIISLGAIVAGTNFLSKKSGAEALTGAAALPMMPSPLRIFVLITAIFAILSVSINVMQFAGGMSEIRPVNVIPAPVGLVFGPVGALACALGNLLGDIARLERYGLTVVLVVCCVDTVVLAVAYVMARRGMSLGSSPVMKLLAAMAVACAAATCLVEGREAKV